MQPRRTLSIALLLLQVSHGVLAQPLPPLPGPVPVPPAPIRRVPIPPVFVPVPVPVPSVRTPRVVVPAQRDVWYGTYNRALIREMQAALNFFGFNAGIVDGIIGGQTRRAIRAYQRSLGAVATGLDSNSKCDTRYVRDRHGTELQPVYT